MTGLIFAGSGITGLKLAGGGITRRMLPGSRITVLILAGSGMTVLMLYTAWGGVMNAACKMTGSGQHNYHGMNLNSPRYIIRPSFVFFYNDKKKLTFLECSNCGALMSCKCTVLVPLE